MALIDNLLNWLRKRHEIRWEPDLLPGEEVVAKIAVALDLDRSIFGCDRLDDRIAFLTNRRLIWNIWHSKADNETQEIPISSILEVDPVGGQVGFSEVVWGRMGGGHVTIIVDNIRANLSSGKEKTSSVVLLFRKKSDADQTRHVLRTILNQHSPLSDT